MTVTGGWSEWPMSTISTSLPAGRAPSSSESREHRKLNQEGSGSQREPLGEGGEAPWIVRGHQVGPEPAHLRAEFPRRPPNLNTASTIPYLICLHCRPAVLK